MYVCSVEIFLIWYSGYKKGDSAVFYLCSVLQRNKAIAIALYVSHGLLLRSL